MNQAPTLPTGVGEIEFFHWFFPSASSGSIQRLNYVVRNVGVSRPFVLLKESLVFNIQARCVDWPTATGDGCSSSTENCSLEALVSLLDWDAARRDGYNISLQLATEQVPVGFTEVPSLLGWAVDNRQLESYVDEQWSVLTMREVSQHCLASWLVVVTNWCDPTQIWREVLLPSCRIECTTLLGIMGQSKITVGCPFRQGLSILVRFWVSPTQGNGCWSRPRMPRDAQELEAHLGPSVDWEVCRLWIFQPERCHRSVMKRLGRHQRHHCEHIMHGRI